jgi:hypothetical protein
MLLFVVLLLFCCVRLGVLGKSVSFHYFFCCLGKSQAARPVSERLLKTGSLCLSPKKQAHRDDRAMPVPKSRRDGGRLRSCHQAERAAVRARGRPGLLPNQKKMPWLLTSTSTSTALAPTPPTTPPDMEHNTIKQPSLSSLLPSLQRLSTSPKSGRRLIYKSVTDFPTPTFAKSSAAPAEL